MTRISSPVTPNVRRSLTLAALLAATTFACGGTSSPTRGDLAATTSTTEVVRTLTSTAEDGTTTVDTVALAAALPAPSSSDQLTPDEVAGLLWMREEEKLAHDVYVVLGDAWGLQIFSNISRSEQSHTDAVKALLDRYGLADPSVGKELGSFTDPAIQALYDQLVARGMSSPAAALQVGATIEDLDIVDLQDRASTNPAIDLVYDNLELGSRNHLRAFVTNLERQGLTYTPEHLTAEAYQAIIDSPMERGATS